MVIFSSDTVAFRSIGRSQGEGPIPPFGCPLAVSPSARSAFVHLRTIGIADRSRLDQLLVEGRGGGDRAPGVPFEPVGPGPKHSRAKGGIPFSAQTPNFKPLVRIRKRGPPA